MQSPRAHLRAPEDRGVPPFDPDCPVCRRARLAGGLACEGLVSRRTQAVLATAVLALSVAAPATVFATEQDQVHEGSAPLAQVEGGDPALGVDFDPGGDATDLPYDAPPVQGTSDPGSGAVAPPATGTDAPAADEPAATATQQEPAAPPAQHAAADPSSPAAPAGSEAPPTGAAMPTAPADSEEPPMRAAMPTDVVADTRTRERRPSRKPKAERPDRARPRDTRAPAARPGSGGAPGVASSPTSVAVAQAAPTTSPAVAGHAGHAGRAEPGDRFHVVRAGESLWSIATDLLGDGASAARIAREVDRLWELNEQRIGSGNPDLLMIGTRLALR